MIKVLFTLDYEIHGNGEGNPVELMVEPTSKLLKLLSQYGAKLTIMADVAEILKFKEYYENHGKDEFGYLKIVEQLKYAVRKGHDVQLHIHSSYFKAKFVNGKLKNSWDDYDLANLPYERIDQMVRESKCFLESNLKSVDTNYSCNVFRAANWSMVPSCNIIKALRNNGFSIDTSVFKYGKRKGLVNFDYSLCPNDALPWLVDDHDVLTKNSSGGIFEFPIYSENLPIWAFFSLNRIYRTYLSRGHNFKEGINHLAKKDGNKFSRKSKLSKMYTKLTSKSALKADFNQCTGNQLLRQLKRVEKNYANMSTDVPFITIGHSKLFTPVNRKSLRTFLKYVSQNPDRYKFAIFKDFDLESYSSI